MSDFRRNVEKLFEYEDYSYGRQIDQIVEFHDKALAEQRSLLKQNVEGALNLYCDIADAEEKANWTKHCTCLNAAAHAVKEAFDEPEDL